MEKDFANLQRRLEETIKKKNQQITRLDEIKIDMLSKISEERDLLTGPADEYLRIIDRLQNQISKIEAFSCFENGKLKHVNSILSCKIFIYLGITVKDFLYRYHL